MAAIVFLPNSKRTATPLLSALTAIALMATGCDRETKTEAPQPRPVRSSSPKRASSANPFRSPGKFRRKTKSHSPSASAAASSNESANVGDRVTPDQVLAKLDPQNELNAPALGAGGASAAEGRLVAGDQHSSTARKRFSPRGFTTQVLFDQAQQALRTAQAQVDDAKAQLHIAKDRVSYTELKADVAGTDHRAQRRIGRGGAGRTDDFPGRPPGRARRRVRRAGAGHPLGAADPEIVVSLTDDPSVTAMGRVRQVDPQADPITRTFRVRVEPDRSAERHVAGRDGQGTDGPRSRRPASPFPPARSPQSTAAGGLDRRSGEHDGLSCITWRSMRFDPATVVISHGLDGGEIVVTAGVQALHPGQKVRLLGAPP